MADPESKSQSAQGASGGGAKASAGADTSGEQTPTASSGGEPGDAIALLKSDHRKVEQLFEKFEATTRRSDKRKIVAEVCKELIVHTMLEEEIFYPACREHVDDDDLLDEAQVEHDGAKVLINELLAGSPADAYYDAKVSVLAEYIKHHVAEEEKRGEGLFAKAKAAGLDTGELGERISQRKKELMQQGDSLRARPKAFRASSMGNGGSERDGGEMRARQGRDFGEDNSGGDRERAERRFGDRDMDEERSYRHDRGQPQGSPRFIGDGGRGRFEYERDDYGARERRGRFEPEEDFRESPSRGAPTRRFGGGQERYEGQARQHYQDRERDRGRYGAGGRFREQHDDRRYGGGRDEDDHDSGGGRRR